METAPTEKSSSRASRRRSRKQAPPTAAADPPEPKIDTVAVTIARYAEFGWVAIRPPHGCINDIIAQKANKLHFVQVVTPESVKTARHTDIQKNTFIQNALSNSAVPIFAMVTAGARHRNGTMQITVTFEDANIGTRVIIGKKPGAAPPTAGASGN